MSKYQQAVEAYAAGEPIVDICRTYSVPRSGLYNHVKAAGIPLRANEIESDQLRTRIVELYTAGQSTGEIAEQLGLSRAAVYRQLRKAKQPMAMRLTSQEVSAAVVDDYSRGLTYAQITARNKVSSSTIGNLVREAGLPSRVGYDPEQCRYARELHETGMAVRTIANQFGYSPRRVSTMIRIAGGEVKPSRYPKERENEIAATYMELRNVSWTAKAVGCAPTTVVRVIDERDLPRPQLGRPTAERNGARS